MSILVLPTARPVAPRPEHVLVQTALAPTLSQWVPALIHPHVTLGPCTPLGVQSLRRSSWTATVRPVSACSESLTCAITLNARSGLKDTRANVPRRPSRRSWNDDARGSHHSVPLLQFVQPGQRRRPTYAIAISLGPPRDQGHFQT